VIESKNLKKARRLSSRGYEKGRISLFSLRTTLQ